MAAGPAGFDLDVTLIDSRPAIIAAFEAMSRDMSVSVDLESVNRRLGLKLEDELAYWLPADGITEAAACYRRSASAGHAPQPASCCSSRTSHPRHQRGHRRAPPRTHPSRLPSGRFNKAGLPRLE
jgi:hypothetical protein